MFEDRGYKRTFYSAPQSVTSLVAAFLEPTLTVAVFLGVTAWFDEPVGRSDLTLCLLVFALTFPGRNRFKDSLLAAADLYEGKLQSAATGYKLLKAVKEHPEMLKNKDNLAMLGVGNVIAFIVAFIAIKTFIQFLQKNSLRAFGVYRIVAAVAIFVLMYLGYIS